MPKQSCMTQLLSVMNDWTGELENNYSVDAIHLDYHKAFDSIPHKRLLVKLKAHGIQGNKATDLD